VNVVLWIVQVLLALAFGLAGFSKLTQPRQALIDRGMAYIEDLPQPLVKVIGTLEVLGAIGLVAPAWTGIAPVLTPIAAVGFMALMVGAMITHLRRGEQKMIVANAFLFLLAAFVAWGRFGPYAS
jgi:uncharacterized membrane protein YphA (DoxX/SURF4 family)